LGLSIQFAHHISGLNGGEHETGPWLMGKNVKSSQWNKSVMCKHSVT